MIHQMTGINRGISIPVLSGGNKHAVSNKEKVDLLVRIFQWVRSTSNVDKEGQLRRGQMVAQERHKLEINMDNSNCINVFFFHG